ncbi:hypothetical protein RchiOBHm_Chr2g0161341 [Rosa chinensis]|uniref:Uncharacterized protein n=1 Tax=Rosa chinensis TaxID=74649 RepID=A0A2P6S2Q8_ROSCH|nr:hypothetical protein RchiOBHm_Chr2g0161341 [Rosa chinensis]
MLILLSGILQNPALETSVLSVWHIRRGLGYMREALSKLMDC